MKKLLALLLALLMPVSVLAETYEVSLSLATDEALFSQYVKQMIVMDSTGENVDPDKLAAAVARILNGLGFSMKVQEDAAAIDIQLGGASVLDMVVHTEQDATFMTSSLLPGYCLRQTLDASTAQESAMADEIASVDWQAVLQRSSDALQAWQATIEPTIMTGVFSGDAYEGGTRCTSWVLTDKDIAALLNALMTDELRSVIAKVLTLLDVDAEDLLAQFDALNARVAEEDAYIYMLRAVENDAGQVIGLSLTVMQEYYQVATVSVGLSVDEIRLVTGLGVNEQNYWWEMSCRNKMDGKKRSVSGVSREWMAAKSDGFAYVKASMESLTNYQWQFNVSKAENVCVWDGSFSTWDGQNYEVLGTTSGVFDSKTNAMNGVVGMGAAPNEPIKLAFSFAETEAIAALDSSAIVCDLPDPADAELAEKLLNQLGTALLARLIKRLPMELLLSLPQLSIPQ